MTIPFPFSFGPFVGFWAKLAVIQSVLNVGSVWLAILGLPLLFEAPPGLAFFDCGGVRLMLSTPEGSGEAAMSSILYYEVADIHRAHATLAAELEALLAAAAQAGQDERRAGDEQPPVPVAVHHRAEHRVAEGGDEHLRAADFFSAAEFPTITFAAFFMVVWPATWLAARRPVDCGTLVRAAVALDEKRDDQTLRLAAAKWAAGRFGRIVAHDVLQLAFEHRQRLVGPPCRQHFHPEHPVRRDRPVVLQRVDRVVGRADHRRRAGCVRLPESLERRAAHGPRLGVRARARPAGHAGGDEGVRRARAGAAALDAGLGTRSGIDLRGEGTGIIPTDEWIKRWRKDGKWWGGEAYLDGCWDSPDLAVLLEVMMLNEPHYFGPYEKNWLARLHELLAPGGLLIVSTHGPYARDVIYGKRWQEQLEEEALRELIRYGIFRSGTCLRSKRQFDRDQEGARRWARHDRVGGTAAVV